MPWQGRKEATEKPQKYTPRRYYVAECSCRQELYTCFASLYPARATSKPPKSAAAATTSASMYNTLIMLRGSNKREKYSLDCAGIYYPAARKQLFCMKRVEAAAAATERCPTYQQHTRLRKLLYTLRGPPERNENWEKCIPRWCCPAETTLCALFSSTYPATIITNSSHKKSVRQQQQPPPNFRPHPFQKPASASLV